MSDVFNDLKQSHTRERELRAEVEALKAEIARLRDIIDPGDAAAYEEGMASKKQQILWFVRFVRFHDMVEEYTKFYQLMYEELALDGSMYAPRWDYDREQWKLEI